MKTIDLQIMEKLFTSDKCTHKYKKVSQTQSATSTSMVKRLKRLLYKK